MHLYLQRHRDIRQKTAVVVQASDHTLTGVLPIYAAVSDLVESSTPSR